MKANRLIMIGLIAASLLAGCKKKDDNNTNSHLNMDGISFSASTEQHDRNTRTYLEGEDIKWMNGDKILVTNSANQQGEFEVTGGIGTTNGTFHSANDFDQAPEYNAAYPFGIASISGTTATFTMSGTQTITATGTFANGAMPMVAHSDDETLNFRNVFGGLCLPIKGAGISVTKIVLTSSNTNEMLWGTFNADCTSSDPNPTNISGGTNVLELVCNPAVELQGAQSQDFVFMIPEGTLQTGFTFAVYSTGTEPVYSKPVNFPNGNFSTTENLINRSRIRKVNTDINIEAALEVETYSPTFISYDKAWMGGTVTGGTPTECGVIYATYDALSGNPDNLVMTGSNVYSVEMTPSGTAYNDWANELTKNTVYFVKAYAISASGETYYGEAIPFATRRDYVNDYQGKLQGAFSIASGEQRNFAMGNLQYNTSTDTWRYAEYQFEYVGYGSLGNVYANGEQPVSGSGEKSDNAGIHVFSDPWQIDSWDKTHQSNNDYNHSYTGWIDWFTWGSSGVNHHNPEVSPVLCQPWCRIKYFTGTSEFDWQDDPAQGYPMFHNYHSENDQLYYAFNDPNRNLEGDADWARNTISNGGAPSKHTPSADQWHHLLKVRPASIVNGVSNARFSYARIIVRNGQNVNGMLLFPDNFTWPAVLGDNYPSHINVEPAVGEMTGYWDEVASFTEAQWSLLEYANAVFLPCDGCYGRSGHCEWGNDSGRYWTSTVFPGNAAHPTSGAYDFAFSPRHTGEGTVNAYSIDCKFYGFSVRFMIP